MDPLYWNSPCITWCGWRDFVCCCFELLFSLCYFRKHFITWFLLQSWNICSSKFNIVGSYSSWKSSFCFPIILLIQLDEKIAIWENLLQTASMGKFLLTSTLMCISGVYYHVMFTSFSILGDHLVGWTYERRCFNGTRL